ncbi:hypothetical protein D3C78_1242860 [compost metagenome]
MDAGDVDDAAMPAAAFQAADEFAAAVERAEQVDAQLVFPVLRIGVAHRHVAGAGRRGVDQQGRRAQLPADLLEHLRHRLRMALVELQQRRTPPLRLDLAAGVQRALAVVQIGHRDIRPLAGEGDGDGLADAGIGAGDQCDLVEQLMAVHISPPS